MNDDTASPVLPLVEASLEPAGGRFTEDRARQWLADNTSSAKTVRELAELWGWHRSSVSRFLSRIRGETSPETKAETAETSETAAPPISPEFDWSPKSEDLIVPSQQALAVYLNGYGQLVIRAQGYDDEDTFICVSPEYVPRLIEKLRAVLKELEADG
jgi:hypothetical protein